MFTDSYVSFWQLTVVNVHQPKLSEYSAAQGAKSYMVPITTLGHGPARSTKACRRLRLAARTFCIAVLVCIL